MPPDKDACHMLEAVIATTHRKVIAPAMLAHAVDAALRSRA